MKKENLGILMLFVLGFGGTAIVQTQYTWRLDTRIIDEQEANPKVFPYPPPQKLPLLPQIYILVAGSTGVGVFLVTTCVILFHREKRALLEFLLAFWVLGPPAWFFLEYSFIFRHWGNHEAFESLKYMQDLGSRIWVGGVGLMIAILWRGGKGRKREE